MKKQNVLCKSNRDFNLSPEVCVLLMDFFDVMDLLDIMDLLDVMDLLDLQGRRNYD